jgi:hypothetical protein
LQLLKGILVLDIDNGLLPWEAYAHQLINWWDMEQFSASTFFEIGKLLGLTANENKHFPANELLDQKACDTYSNFLAHIRADCLRIHLHLSVKFIDTLLGRMKRVNYQEFSQEVEVLQDRIRDEMEQYLFMFIPAARSGFYDQPELFGQAILKRLPSIQFDMIEAGNCYAAGRGTAAVFHLMRIMETGVQEFGTKLGVAIANEKNWQNILDEANKAIKALNPKEPQTVALSQVSANLYAVKVAWRNEVMHPKDTYTLEEADNLIRQVRTFMSQLVAVI